MSQINIGAVAPGLRQLQNNTGTIGVAASVDTAAPSYSGFKYALVMFRMEATAGLSQQMFMRINNIATASYDQTFINGAALLDASATTSFGSTGLQYTAATGRINGWFIYDLSKPAGEENTMIAGEMTADSGARGGLMKVFLEGFRNTVVGLTSLTLLTTGTTSATFEINWYGLT